MDNIETFTKKEKLYSTSDQLGLPMTSSQSIKLEKDYVNYHPCMESLVEIIDFLHINFADTRTNDILPGYIQQILSELKREDCHINTMIFFFKLIVNKPEVFEKYIHVFFPLMLKYCVAKNNGGKGFHYFLRDITCLLTNYSPNLDYNKENVELISNFVNYLIKISGDTKNIIFKTNLSK